MASSSRPSTPNSQARKSSRRHLHRSSGVYLLSQSPKIHYPVDVDNLPLESATNTEKFERLSDAVDELDNYMVDLALIHEAISNGFNESFASFLYGLSITMWCVDYPGCPTRASLDRLQQVKQLDGRISALEQKVKEARAQNALLKENFSKLEKPSNEKKPYIPGRSRAPGSGVTIQNSNSHDDDSYITNEGSFVTNPANHRMSRIPQPVKTSANTNRFGRQEVTVKSYNHRMGPNLDQPPRYMRGLFDRSNTQSSLGALSRSKVPASSMKANPTRGGRVAKPTRSNQK